jgi:hypothetical protein
MDARLIEIIMLGVAGVVVLRGFYHIITGGDV